MSMKVNALDHLVINVRDVERSAKWYATILGMEIRVFDPGPGKTPRTSLVFGNQKINVRPRDADKVEWFTADHPLDYGYGEGSPLAKLVAAGGKVLMLGAPLDTLTLLHHAEHLADIPGKRIKRVEVPLATPAGRQWRMIEEFDTGDPIVDGLAEDYFAEIVTQFLASGQGRKGLIGSASSVLVGAAAITAFGVSWLETRFGSGSP